MDKQEVIKMRKRPTSITRQKSPISEIQFCAWVAQALPGDRLEYHRGHLAVDADKITSDLDLNCPSSYKMGHQRGLSIGGSGSFV